MQFQDANSGSHCVQFQDAIGLVQPVLVSVQGTWCEVFGKNGVFMKAEEF